MDAINLSNYRGVIESVISSANARLCAIFSKNALRDSDMWSLESLSESQGVIRITADGDVLSFTLPVKPDSNVILYPVHVSYRHAYGNYTHLSNAVGDGMIPNPDSDADFGVQLHEYLTSAADWVIDNVLLLRYNKERAPEKPVKPMKAYAVRVTNLNDSCGLLIIVSKKYYDKHYEIEALISSKRGRKLHDRLDNSSFFERFGQNMYMFTIDAKTANGDAEAVLIEEAAKVGVKLVFGHAGFERIAREKLPNLMLAAKKEKFTYLHPYPVNVPQAEPRCATVTISFRFERPVTRQEGTQNINEWFRRNQLYEHMAVLGGPSDTDGAWILKPNVKN